MVALVLAGCGGGEEPAATTAGAASTTTTDAATTTTAQRSEREAVEAWLVEHRSEVFAGYEGELVGECTDGLLEGLCTIPREDLGVRKIEAVGVAASDWGADLLLERGEGGWAVVDVWAWDLESGEAGPPFSPLTALAGWWSTTAPGVTFVRECEQADPADIDQELVCAELVEADDETRTYRTGPPPAVDEHVVELHHQPDHTWTVG